MRAIEGVEAVSDNSYQRYIRVKGEVGRIKATHNEQANGFDICHADGALVHRLLDREFFTQSDLMEWLREHDFSEHEIEEIEALFDHFDDLRLLYI